jgi:small-conductance mechanosensitive channel
MDEWINPQQVTDLATAAWAWVREQVLVLPNLLQLLAVGIALAGAAFARPQLRRLIERLASAPRWKRLADNLQPLVLPLVWLLLVGIAWQAAVLQGWPARILEIAASLLMAWVIISIASGLISNPVWARAVAMSAWTIAALNILRLLDPTVALLDSFAIQFGAVRISLLTVTKSVFALAVLLWLATVVSETLESRLRHSPNLTPSVQVLFGKLLKFSLITIAVLAAISTTGMDMTALAVFGGAVGVGIGLGLQRVIANLFSGLILLLDKSIKPGDVVAVAGTYGWVNTLGGRYVSVVTRDGIEHLIPNEEFITTRVENWTHTDSKIRLKIPIGVHYKSDVERALAVCVECRHPVRHPVRLGQRLPGPARGPDHQHLDPGRGDDRRRFPCAAQVRRFGHHPRGEPRADRRLGVQLGGQRRDLHPAGAVPVGPAPLAAADDAAGHVRRPARRPVHDPAAALPDRARARQVALPGGHRLRPRAGGQRGGGGNARNVFIGLGAGAAYKA